MTCSWKTCTVFISKFIPPAFCPLTPKTCSSVLTNISSPLTAKEGYRGQKGKIQNGMESKKIISISDDFGVFSSASKEASEEALIQGRTLLNGIDINGIVQPEFKYDFRDKKYKLTEINLRSTMWHRGGNLSGVNLHYIQYLDAPGKE